LSQKIQVKVKTKKSSRWNHISIHVQKAVPGAAEPRLVDIKGDDLSREEALTLAGTVLPAVLVSPFVTDTTGLESLIPNLKRILTSYVSPPPYFFPVCGEFWKRQQYRLDLEITGVYPMVKQQ